VLDSFELRVLRGAVRDNGVERRAIRKDWLVEREGSRGDAARLDDGTLRQTRGRRELLHRRPASGRGREPGFRAVDGPPSLDDLLGQPDEARLVRERVAYRAAHAKARVGFEVSAPSRVVVLDGVEQSE
jgi:hypothetical protein